MASAVIASQNESSWAHMGKIPYSGRHLNANPNPNPNPKKKPKQYHNAASNGVSGRYHNNVDSPVVTQTASDDAYSFNQTSTSRNAVNYGRSLTFNLASYTKYELLELRKRLSAELGQIRDLQNRIDSGQLSPTGNPRSHAKFKKCSVNERPIAAFGSIPDRASKELHNGNLNTVICDSLLKECRQIVTKLLKLKHGSIFKAPVDAAALGLHDYHQIVKHPMDLGTVKANLSKNLYPTPVEFAADVRLTFNNALLYNPKHDPVHGIAQQLLVRFEELFRPIQEKIDTCNDQHREREFHEPRLIEDRQHQRNQVMQANSWSNQNQSPAFQLRGKKVRQRASPVRAPQVSRKVERMKMPKQAHSSASTSSDPPPLVSNHLPTQGQFPSPARVPIETVQDQKPARGVPPPPVKQPKPKAKDPIKREMSMDEKQRLGFGLQTLPQEKMPQLVQIIGKRNEHLAQDGDEIELDIEALDTETLWELDRFVTNWKKFVSKTKRQSQVINKDSAAGITEPSSPVTEADMGLLSDKNDNTVKKPKDNDDEDVDIDDDMPAASFPPVEIEKDEGAGVGGGDGQDHVHEDRGNASSSSSGSGSSSSGSSSSDSDSGSSSESDSDADDAQS